MSTNSFFILDISSDDIFLGEMVEEVSGLFWVPGVFGGTGACVEFIFFAEGIFGTALVLFSVFSVDFKESVSIEID